MAEFIEDFAKALAEGGEKSDIERETKEVFQNNLKFSPDEFSSIFEADKALKEEAGRWKLNGVSSEEFASKMRSGKLTEMIEQMNVKGVDRLNLLEKQKTLRQIIHDCPEVFQTELSEKFDKLAKNIKELNQNVEKLTEMNESLQRIVLEKAEKAGWIKLPKPLSLITTTALVGLIAELVTIMQKMKGCYFHQTIDGKVEKFKIKSRSINKEIPLEQNDYANLHKPSNYLDKCTNLTLKIRQVFQNSKTNDEQSLLLKKKLVEFCFGKKENPTADEIKLCIRQKAGDLQKFFNDNDVKVSAPLDLLTDEEKKSRSCVACDPSESIDSLSYTSRNGLATNETFHCVSEVTLYEAFKNFGNNVLKDVVNEFSDLLGLKGLLLTVGKYLLLFVVLYLIGYFAVTYFTKTKHYERLEEEETEIQMKPLKAA